MESLTQEYVRSVFEYKEGELYWKNDRGKNKTKGKKAGSDKSHLYRRIRLDGVNIYAHRLIFLYHHGYLPDLVDHINGNKLDNRVENLREGDKSINALNVGLTSKNKSGVKGVYFDKKRRKWVVMLSVEGKTKYFGGYGDIEMAELVAIEARCKYHKEFARHE